MSELPSTPDGAAARRIQINKAAFFAALGLALLIFIAGVTSTLHRSHDLGKILTGLFASLFGALIVAVVGAWGVMGLLSPRPAATSPDPARGDDLERLLAPTLTQLEAARTDIAHQVNLRMASRIPICIAIAVGFWIFSQFGRRPADFGNLLQLMAFGAAIGWYWASQKLSDQYRRLYKERVLPQLAAQFGALSYRPAITPDVGLMRDQHLFREFDRVIAEDEIFGVYRGMALNIVELKLTHGSGKEQRTEFDGLLTQVELPRRLSGVTSVVADNGLLGNLEDRFVSEGRQRVRVEDPTFEKLYEVYGTDQVAARALLTPAFMERFLSLGARAGYSRPLALAQDNRLTIALPKSGGKNLFEPPSYRHPAASRQTLLELYGDIQAVLSAADAVIDLDQFSRTAKPAPTVT
jgi:hypothetical protein